MKDCLALPIVFRFSMGISCGYFGLMAAIENNPNPKQRLMAYT